MGLAMDIIERLRKDLATASTAQLLALAVDMGVPSGTLRKVVKGVTRHPRYNFVLAVQAYYDRLPVAPPPLPPAHEARAD